MAEVTIQTLYVFPGDRPGPNQRTVLLNIFILVTSILIFTSPSSTLIRMQCANYLMIIDLDASKSAEKGC